MAPRKPNEAFYRIPKVHTNQLSHRLTHTPLFCSFFLTHHSFIFAVFVITAIAWRLLDPESSKLRASALLQVVGQVDRWDECIVCSGDVIINPCGWVCVLIHCGGRR